MYIEITFFDLGVKFPAMQKIHSFSNFQTVFRIAVIFGGRKRKKIQRKITKWRLFTFFGTIFIRFPGQKSLIQDDSLEIKSSFFVRRKWQRFRILCKNFEENGFFAWTESWSRASEPFFTFPYANVYIHIYTQIRPTKKKKFINLS